ncbi:MAG: hypothetical protein FJ128_12775 [Deltaproteobacteria bacterium]|nr:hypothetical protein [Deltaproteobacteria bacterium]
MRRIALLLALMLLFAACIDVGYGNFTVKITINRDGSYSFGYDGIMGMKPEKDQTDEQLAQELQKGTMEFKELKPLGNHCFKVLYECQGDKKRPLSFFGDRDTSLVVIEYLGDTVVLVKIGQKLLDATKENYKNYNLQYEGTVSITTDAKVLQHNAQTAPWFTLWGTSTYQWKLTSLETPAGTMVLQLP